MSQPTSPSPSRDDKEAHESVEKPTQEKPPESEHDIAPFVALQNEMNAVAKSFENKVRIYRDTKDSEDTARILQLIRIEARKLRRLRFILEEKLDDETDRDSHSEPRSRSSSRSQSSSQESSSQGNPIPRPLPQHDDKFLMRSTGELKWIRISRWSELLDHEASFQNGGLSGPAIYAVNGDMGREGLSPSDDPGALGARTGPRPGLPTWIVIRSRPLFLYIIREACGPRSFYLNVNSMGVLQVTALAIARPFKALIYYASELRKEDYDSEWTSFWPVRTYYPEFSPSLGVPQLTGLIKDLQSLIGFLDEHIIPTRDLFKTHNLKTNLMVEFPDLWHVFAPGSLVYVKNNNIPQKIYGGFYALSEKSHDYRNSSIQTEVDINDPSLTRLWPLKLTCYYFHFNGQRYFSGSHTFSIEAFLGTELLANLSVIPFPTAEACGLIDADDLVERGRDFVAYTHPTHLDYVGRNQMLHPDGTGIDPSPDDGSQDNVTRYSELIDSDVMVDMDRGYFSVPRSPSGSPTHRLEMYRQKWAFDDGSYWENRKATQVIGEETEKWQRMDRDHPPTQRDHLLLLPSRVFGFVFRTPCLQLGNGPDGARMLHGRKLRTIPWDDLELPDGHKTCSDTPIRNLQFDLIRAKGKGVIILLHGVPGVGKTSTAAKYLQYECIAEANNKPLFPITCGDLGTSPREVETRLQEAVQLAQLWNCVLLLDEADVFLAQRSEHDIQRNALVSVFLRLLEYYQGILFLTSNRVGVFDEAFKSRIHMALYYPPLDWDQTDRIWVTHLTKLRSSGLFEFDHNEIIRYAKIHFNSQTEPGSHFGPVWNGRQIRNGFQSAVALAAYNHRGTDKIRLTTDEFEKVSKVSNQFNDYLWSIQGRTDSEKASTWGVRDDAWNQTGATRNNHGVQNLNRAMPTRNVPKDVWVMGQGLSAAAAGPSYQISPPQQPLHPHPIIQIPSQQGPAGLNSNHGHGTFSQVQLQQQVGQPEQTGPGTQQQQQQQQQ
ncbi:hypothetical protein V8F06_009035 [Rhypophila decipiens]